MGRKLYNLNICFIVFTLIALPGLQTGPAWAEMGELESYIRARIEIGESMRDYMRELREGGGYDSESGGPSMEKMREMEEEINAMVAGILESYGLTIQRYEERSPEVFSDPAAVDAFLDAQPDLKERYAILPLHRARPGGGS